MDTLKELREQNKPSYYPEFQIYQLQFAIIERLDEIIKLLREGKEAGK